MIDLTIVLTISQTPYSGASYSLLSKDNIIDFPDSVNKFHKIFTWFSGYTGPHLPILSRNPPSNTYRSGFVWLRRDTGRGRLLPHTISDSGRMKPELSRPGSALSDRIFALKDPFCFCLMRNCKRNTVSWKNRNIQELLTDRTGRRYGMWKPYSTSCISVPFYPEKPEYSPVFPNLYFFRTPEFYTIPCASIASTTFSNPAMLAPTT